MDSNVQHSPNLGKVVVFTNIDDQDFEHAFGGTPFRVRAGESQHMPYDLADHLATHLARKMLLRGDTGKNIFDPTDKSGGTGSKIWGPEDEGRIKARILGDTYERERSKPETEIEALQRQIRELNQFKQDFLNDKKQPEEGSVLQAKPEENNGIMVSPSDDPSVLAYETKADVINKMKELGLKYDARQNKEALLAQLKQHLSDKQGV